MSLILFKGQGSLKDCFICFLWMFCVLMNLSYWHQCETGIL
jgi:hypothetical protein